MASLKFDLNIVAPEAAEASANRELQAREVHIPKKIDFDFLSQSKLDFKESFDQLGWIPFFQIDQKINIHHIQEFYHHLEFPDPFAFSTSVNGKDMLVTVWDFCDIFSLPRC